MNKSKTLEEVITTKSLRSIAGSVYYSRGDDYFKGACVGKLKIEENCVSATVRVIAFTK